MLVVVVWSSVLVVWSWSARGVVVVWSSVLGVVVVAWSSASLVRSITVVGVVVGAVWSAVMVMILARSALRSIGDVGSGFKMPSLHLRFCFAMGSR